MKQLELVPWYDYVRARATSFPAVGDWIHNPDDSRGRSEVVVIHNNNAVVEQFDGVAADYIPFRLEHCAPLNYDNKQPVIGYLVKALEQMDYKHKPVHVVAAALLSVGVKIK